MHCPLGRIGDNYLYNIPLIHMPPRLRDPKIPVALIDHSFLRGVLNSCSYDEELQVAAYKVLNISGYRLTEQEWGRVTAAHILRALNVRSINGGAS
jgi:hypothetical protein